jgi:uncharacterized protein YndB with AHSA1/START domain
MWVDRLNNRTIFRIEKPVHEVYEAFVNPAKIGNFWFSSSSARWEAGQTITLFYNEYNAQVVIQVLETVPSQKIVFQWGPPGGERVVTFYFKEREPSGMAIEVTEEGFDDQDPNLIQTLVDNKEGWVFMLTCLKGYMEFGVTGLRTGILK